MSHPNANLLSLSSDQTSPETKLVAFLRAINVGGHNITMARLRELFEEMGFSEVETFIASGNVIFRAPATQKTTELEQEIERYLQQALGYDVKTFIRTAVEIQAIAAYSAFPLRQLESAGALNVALLAKPMDQEAIALLMSLKNEIDDFRTHEREVYWCCRVKQSDSKFSNAVFERKLGIKATFRGVKTMKRLADKLDD